MKPRYLAVLILMVLAGLVSFGLPKVKYTSPDVLSKLDIPIAFEGWRGQDISNTINPRTLEENFISRIFARYYVNRFGQPVMFLILDAGNFHNPKICFGMSGASIKELPPIELKASDKVIKPIVLYTEKDGKGTAIVYWLCVDKKVLNWGQHKWKQLAFSLLNRQKIGFMVRIEIPTAPALLESRINLAQEFTTALIASLSQEQVEYIFGK